MKVYISCVTAMLRGFVIGAVIGAVAALIHNVWVLL